MLHKYLNKDADAQMREEQFLDGGDFSNHKSEQKCTQRNCSREIRVFKN